MGILKDYERVLLEVVECKPYALGIFLFVVLKMESCNCINFTKVLGVILELSFFPYLFYSTYFAARTRPLVIAFVLEYVSSQQPCWHSELIL